MRKPFNVQLKLQPRSQAAFGVFFMSGSVYVAVWPLQLRIGFWW